MKNSICTSFIVILLLLINGCKSKDPEITVETGPGSISTVVKAGEVGFLTGVAVDSNNKVYFVDGAENVVRRLDPATGDITIVVGIVKPPNVINPSDYEGDGGPATLARLNVPYSVKISPSGNMYIADLANQLIRKVDGSTGIISTFAGTVNNNTYGGDGGPATEAQLWDPYDVAIDASENVYIADKDNHIIRKVDGNTGIITTVAGTPSTEGFDGDGGLATDAKLKEPQGIALDDQGNLYIADTGNHSIRKVTLTTGIITTVAGSGPGGSGAAGDGGLAVAAKLSYPARVILDAAGNLYISDSNNNMIRKVDVGDAKISTVAGNGDFGYSGDGGMAIAAKLANPHGVAVDSDGNIYIADMQNGVVRFVKK